MARVLVYIHKSTIYDQKASIKFKKEEVQLEVNSNNHNYNVRKV